MSDLISIYASKDGKRSMMIAIYPETSISVTTDENDIRLIEGKREDLRELYECLKELFDEEGDDEEC